jgi:hypothetical protein
MSFASKTFKREYAAAFVAVLCLKIYQGDVQMVEAIVWPFISFVAASAGLHIYDKTSGNSTSPAPDGVQRD